MDVSSAIVLWMGWGRAAYPSRDDEVILAKCGPGEGVRLLRKVRQLENDFYASDAHITAPDLPAMAARAAEDFRRLHPDIHDDAIEAFAWAYTFDYR